MSPWATFHRLSIWKSIHPRMSLPLGGTNLGRFTNGWNPIDYLCQAFERLATAKSPEDVKALLPWNMSKSESAE